MTKHEIPREKKSETRLFSIFSIRSLLYTLVFLVLGFIIGAIVKIIIPSRTLMYIIIGLIGAFGFLMGTVPIRPISFIPATKDVQGLYLHQVIVTYIKYKSRRSLKVIDEGV